MTPVAASRGILDWLLRAESLAAAAFLLCMAALPVVELLLRNFVDVGIPGASAIRVNMTLWVGFLGAMLASRRDRHLRISAAFDHLPDRFKARIGPLVAMICTAVGAGLTWGAVDFVVQETWSQVTVGGLPIWVVECIFPLAFAVVTLRFISHGRGLAEKAAAALGIALAATVFYGLVPLDGVFVAVALVGLFAAFVLGAPIFVLLGGAAVILFTAADVPAAAIHVEAYRLVSSPAVPAIPLFALTGFILTEGTAGERLVRVFDALFGWLPGGLAVVTCLLFGFFTAFTGASGVTILALGGLLLPTLIKHGYGESFSLGLVTSTGSIGLLLPPSLAIILYGVVAHVSIIDLFVAALIPGLVMIAALSLYGAAVGVRKKVVRLPFNARAALAATWQAKWDLLVPFVALGSIFGGIATLVEAAAIVAVYVLVVEIAMAGPGHTLRKLPAVLLNCSALVGGIFIILAVAMGLTNYLVDAEIPQLAAAWVGEAVESRLTFLLLLNLFLLAVGCMMDIYSAIVVVVPLILPISAAFGVHPLHLGVIFLANLELGYLTPPVGINLFLSAYRFERPVTEIVRAIVPFFLVLVAVVLLVTYVPALTLWSAAPAP
ncbi:MAG: TRAP transporter large permease subunit [Rhodovibrionaceae bacterium]|nr:TRAP transporter large permease subunit [Rhodovibrionaceae bacterium]